MKSHKVRTMSKLRQSRMHLTVLTFVLLGLSVSPPTTAATAPTVGVLSGKVMNQQGKNLVDPTCVYLWPQNTAAATGWGPSGDCIELDDKGAFSQTVRIGSYKIAVEATNVASAMFVGGPDVQTATTFAVPAKGLKGLKLKVDTLASVSGKVIDLRSKPLINPNAVIFWAADASTPDGWTALDPAADLDTDGYFTGYLPVGKYKLQIVADNVAANTFVGGDNTLAGGLVVTVAAAGLSKLAYRVPVQPEFSGTVTAIDGSALPFASAIDVWAPDDTDPSGWSLTGDEWSLSRSGEFVGYLVPGPYRLEINYGKPRIRTFFGGATIDKATTFVMPTTDLRQVDLRVGKAAAPHAVANIQGAGADKSIALMWDSGDAADEVAYYRVSTVPAAGSCVTAATMCVVSGLTNGTSYEVTIAAVNETGTTTVSAGSFVPSIPVFTAVPDSPVTTVGSSIHLRIRNAPANAKIALTGKPGVISQSVTANALGMATMTITVTSPGVVALALKAGKAAAKSTVYVPAVKWTTSAKKGKAAKLSVIGAPPNSQLRFNFSNGATVSGVSSAKAAYSGSVTFANTGSYTGAFTVNGVQFGSAVITVS